MAQVRTSAATAIACSLLQSMVDDLAAMGQFRQVQAVMHLAILGLFDTHQGHPAGFGTRIELQGDWLHLTGLAASILESDREGPHPMDHRSFAAQEQARSPL